MYQILVLVRLQKQYLGQNNIQICHSVNYPCNSHCQVNIAMFLINCGLDSLTYTIIEINLTFTHTFKHSLQCYIEPTHKYRSQFYILSHVQTWTSMLYLVTYSNIGLNVTFNYKFINIGVNDTFYHTFKHGHQLYTL